MKRSVFVLRYLSIFVTIPQIENSLSVDKPANKKLLFHMTITAITGRLNKNNIIINFAVRRPNLKAQCLASERIFTFNFLNSSHSAYRLLVTKVDETFSFRIKKFIISRNN